MASGFVRPASNHYRHLLEWLLHVNRGRQVKLGLQNVQDMMMKLGPAFSEDRLKIFHVAGTNGKGSVCWKLAKMLEAMGYKVSNTPTHNPRYHRCQVGLFSSPHISSFRERMSVNGEPIPEEEIEILLPEIVDCCEENDIPATFFELTTILSMGHFIRQEVDYAVYEVGLGGRLDSTNVVNPLVSVITSISLDHMHILGDTVEAIAKEKGGIIKPGIPVVVGPNVPHQVLQGMAESKGCAYIKSGLLPEEMLQGEIDYDDYNVENAAIALETLRQVFPAGTKFATSKLLSLPPCRFQRFKISAADKLKTAELFDSTEISDEDIELVLDVAHNDNAFAKLFTKVYKAYPSHTYHVATVMGLSSSKDVRSCVNHAVGRSSEVYFVRAASERAMELSDLINSARKSGMEGKARVVGNGDILETITAACEAAQSRIVRGSSRRQVIVICGSFFIMKEARNACNISQAVDPQDLNERYRG